MSGQQQVSIAVTGTRVGGGFSDRLGDLDAFAPLADSALLDGRVSHSLLRGLLLLAAFPADGSECGLAEIADRVGFSRPTTHRYVTTWVALGFLEQNPRSRRYRRAQSASG